MLFVVRRRETDLDRFTTQVCSGTRAQRWAVLPMDGGVSRHLYLFSTLRILRPHDLGRLWSPWPLQLLLHRNLSVSPLTANRLVPRAGKWTSLLLSWCSAPHQRSLFSPRVRCLHLVSWAVGRGDAVVTWSLAGWACPESWGDSHYRVCRLQAPCLACGVREGGNRTTGPHSQSTWNSSESVPAL